jgi:flavin reductase ActVB
MTQQLLSPDTVAGADFRDAMARLVAPITIVTTADEHGRRWGFTASSVTSASLEPPLVLVGVARTSSCHPAVTSSGEFVINILGGGHHQTAVQFATSGVDRFDGVRCTQFPGTGLPCLPDACCLIHCRTEQILPVGDHDLLIGAVAGAQLNEDAQPLLHYQRTFRALS